MKFLEDQWADRPVLTSPFPLFTGQEKAAQLLLQALLKKGSVVELIARPGMGKSSILHRLAFNPSTPFTKPPKYIAPSSKFELVKRREEIVHSLLSPPNHNLLIIDGGDLLAPDHVIPALERIRKGFILSTVIASQRWHQIGKQVVIDPLDFPSFQELSRTAFEGRLTANATLELWEATGGEVRSTEGLRKLVEPWISPSLVAPDGTPLRSTDTRRQQIVTDVRNVSSDLLARLSSDGDAVFELTSREFEELVAELLERKGYEVTLTPKTRDGGRDMHAVRHDELGSFLFLVEAKKWARNRPVGIEIVRALRGVAEVERATAAMVVTTSRFTGPAQEFANRIRYQLSLHDYFDLRSWLEEYAPSAG